MANDILHIKDSYYFEVPKLLWRPHRDSIEEFPDWWVRLDEEFQEWEAEHLAEALVELADSGAPDPHDLVHGWEHWKHADHANDGRPLDVYLELEHAVLRKEFGAWKKADAGRRELTFADFVNDAEPEFGWFALPYETSEEFRAEWAKAKRDAGGEKAVAEFRKHHSWDGAKIDGYNHALAGKVIIPQPFGELRNLYNADRGFCISKFMIIEVVIALLIVGVFSWLGRRVQEEDRPKGRLRNLLESVLLFLRDEVARPAIGGREADKFVPLLWTVFLFILGCNLFGMLPWVGGAPTGSFSVTLAMALVTFGTVLLSGMKKFGPLGFFVNQVPGMDLPLPLAIVIKPMILLIELLGLMIKHGVLAVRLLANMVAGHLVLLGIMGLAFGAHAAIQFSDVPPALWGLTAVIAVLGSTLFSCLELFVAFLQAYIFTFLSALFIGAAVHHH